MVIPENIFPMECITIGKASYGQIKVYNWGMQKEKLIIGNFVSMGANIKFMLGGNHFMNRLSTYPFKSKILNEKAVDSFSKGEIIIEADVWIGSDVTILSGVKVGKGAIIGAGSIVAKNIPEYAIAVGNPARVVKYRFERNVIDKIKNFDFDKIDENFIRKNINYLYSDLNEEIIEELMNCIKE